VHLQLLDLVEVDTSEIGSFGFATGYRYRAKNDGRPKRSTRLSRILPPHDHEEEWAHLRIAKAAEMALESKDARLRERFVRAIELEFRKIERITRHRKRSQAGQRKRGRTAPQTELIRRLVKIEGVRNWVEFEAFVSDQDRMEKVLYGNNGEANLSVDPKVSVSRTSVTFTLNPESDRALSKTLKRKTVQNLISRFHSR
tara:strand:- start:114 stop:710 length:597 start_codon:yes stop_codon:yes gene_type:complete